MHPESLTGQASLVTPSRKRFFIMVLLLSPTAHREAETAKAHRG